MRLGLICAFFLVACGPSGGGGGDDTGDDLDADGDTISDADEGSADTDKDGTPNFEDPDSDGDTIKDSIEAGDSKLDTKPVDNDGDGTPDYLDLDSDANGREDKLDGAGDTDNDTLGDYADPDDDNDNIYDIDELGPNPLTPLDTDADGTPDFHDLDSDEDTIVDAVETNADYDGDSVGNFQDQDSDGDCVPDFLEARGNPPADSDMDTRPDFLDRDADNDGILDTAEDANCNGVRDGSESSATDDDTDNDGVSDLVEQVAGTDPNNAASNPQANGDYVFVEPYMKPQTPTEDDLDFSSKLKAIDLYVLLDRSGSMSQEITTVKANLSTVVFNLRCAPSGGGTPPNCIPDLWAGAATVGYAGSGAAAFTHFVDMQPSPSFAAIPTSEPAGCCNEPLTYAAYTALTNTPSAVYFFNGVNARPTCAGSPADTAGYTTFGFPCFRQALVGGGGGALPVVMMATDEAPISGAQVHTIPSWASVVPYYVNIGARFIGILGSNFEPGTDTNLRQMATDTGAVDAANGNAPLVFDGAGANAATAIQNGVLALANGLPIDINAVTADVVQAGETVDAVAAFVDHIETLQLGTAQCANGLLDTDTNGDTYKDKYENVRTGTPVCWKVVSKPNTTVPATQVPQLYRATITVYGDGITQLDTRDVYFLVPPVPLDGPLQ
ncbi:MAG: hypothetical protein M4D80_31875 [Myxococcota bacterium]|nr:hypothetical protein [Myxococcota bacterium]